MTGLYEPFDEELWASLAQPGVKALICDSTNVFNAHEGRYESMLGPDIEALIARCKGTFVSEEYTHLGPDVYLNDDTMSLTVDGVCSKLDEQVDSMQIDVIQSKSPSSIVVSFISPNHADATGLRVEFSFVVRE